MDFSAKMRVAAHFSRRFIFLQVRRNAEADKSAAPEPFSPPKLYRTSMSPIIEDPRLKPIEFSKTRGYEWRARDTFIIETKARPRPRFESEIIGVSLLVAVIYCMVREENDMDEIIGGLSSKVPPVVEMYALRQRLDAIKKGKLKGEPVKPEEREQLENRLRFLIAKHGESGLKK